MLFLSQASWSANDAAKLDTIVRAAAAEASRQNLSGEPCLLLLPHSPDVAAEADAFATLGETASKNSIYLAGSLVAAPAAGEVTATIGFIFGPDGKLELRTGKITPDLVQGFTDTRALPAAEADFP